ncbi:MAG: hypothetical protein ACN6PQ_15345 [Stenotrophomonas indicatrix]|uniref:hypothetical protein n=1 Tax=Stenotrophomonas TaxID=40323 RepID=UPI0003EA77D6|nr:MULTISPECIES: hypothetical protein [Stenotrophomonas]EVT73961.1 hypothetical protein X548_09995 [Stenotrophomonas maltophilia 5BA-I-2]OJH79895.1 MAG: hypothetical protein BSK19_06295 [Stenotrophomonas maltophilia]MCK6233278.1 hypothetical protein [Stenotrophomonas indicatrix]MCR8714487.1 hypothetical protein [Stenotrophomonas indicatrix]MDV3514025.1 hypothetical protein [Stenotrophomonas sp. C1657]
MRAFDLRRLKKDAKKSGMRVVGNFLIASYTRDVISGFAIDPAPSAIYLWTFVLPTYDDLPFLHMSLGQRVAVAKGDERFFCGMHTEYVENLERVRTAADLLIYVDGLDFRNDYSEWIKYISAIRLGDFLAADATLKNLLALPMSSAVQRRLDAIISVLKNGGESGAQHLLETWSVQTARLVGGSSWGSGR